jgi:hypothetical protein
MGVKKTAPIRDLQPVTEDKSRISLFGKVPAQEYVLWPETAIL